MSCMSGYKLTGTHLSFESDWRLSGDGSLQYDEEPMFDGGRLQPALSFRNSNEPLLSDTSNNESIIRDDGVFEKSCQVCLSWRDVNVYSKRTVSRFSVRRLITSAKGDESQRHILKNVFGVARAGRLLAILGSSGAGKSTLLNVLSGRSGHCLDVQGCIKVNGTVIDGSIQRLTAYVHQTGLFYSTLTPREHLCFQAQMRLPHFSAHQRKERVDTIILKFGLRKCENTCIGDAARVKGISGGERRRLLLASEVLTDSPLVICDEPTSGLDSFMALQIVKMLNMIAREGKTVICVMHQPSSQVYAYLDDLYLLSNGQLLFTGDKTEAAHFFERIGFQCPCNFNPADHFLRLMAIVPGRENESRAKINRIAEDFKCYCALGPKNPEPVALKALGDVRRVLQEKDKRQKVPWCRQFRALWRRSLKNTFREPLILKLRFIENMTLAIVIGLVYFGTKISKETIQNVNGVLFSMTSSLVFNFAYGVVDVFPSELPIFLREQQSHMYRVDAYFLAKIATEVPNYALNTLVFLTILYWMAGLYSSLLAYATCVAIGILTSFAAISLGYFISAVFPTIDISMACLSFIIVPTFIFAGFFQNLRSMQAYFRWMQYLSIFKYSYEAASNNQWLNINSIPGCANLSCPSSGSAVLESIGMSVGTTTMNLDMFILFMLTVILELSSLFTLFIRAWINNAC